MREHPLLVIASVSLIVGLAISYQLLVSDRVGDEVTRTEVTVPSQGERVPQAPVSAEPTSEAAPAAAPSVPPVAASRARRVVYDVPFIPQAPGGKWSDPLFKDACEEASTMMAMLYAKDRKAPADIAGALHEVGDYAIRTFGHFVDTSAADTLRLLREYYQVENVALLETPTAEDLRDRLAQGNVIVAPTNGRLLGNPNFQTPGPEYHMLIVIGYDEDRDVFIAHDPGTRLGASYVYRSAVLMGAIADYPTGRHETAKERPARVIVVGKDKVY